MTSATYQVTGMTCEHCARAVTEETRRAWTGSATWPWTSCPAGLSAVTVSERRPRSPPGRGHGRPRRGRRLPDRCAWRRVRSRQPRVTRLPYVGYGSARAGQSDGTGERHGTTDLVIGGMTCASCAARVERKLNRLDGVTATVNFATETARVSVPRRRSPSPT